MPLLASTLTPRGVRYNTSTTYTYEEPAGGEDPESGSGLLVRAVTSVLLVLLGGVFAGLTIGLMGQDEVYLQVVAESGEPEERRAATKVLALLSKGKHWVLVTLLLGNVITNETLPIVLDRLLGGGWAAVASSTVAIVIFGEIIPQSLSVRYGLSLGAFFAPYVLILMYLMSPIAYPTALLLDWALGEDHGTVYKKAGLKSLVTLHQNIGVDRLNEDEVTIISAVLDLKDKPVSSIMTPVQDVFVLSSDTILDEEMVEKIFLTGFNRIPIHHPRQPSNFVGMLLVRILITYDPEDCLPISSFALATLPETHPDTSCLNILNYFQEGKSHMVAVSTNPGATSGVIGVVTLEDVIEELIGEEIVDESDVYVNVHKAIRRQTPGPFRDFKNLVNNSPISKLLPSNRASNPRGTSNTKITIKRHQRDQASESDLFKKHHTGYGSTGRDANQGDFTPMESTPAPEEEEIELQDDIAEATQLLRPEVVDPRESTPSGVISPAPPQDLDTRITETEAQAIKINLTEQADGTQYRNGQQSSSQPSSSKQSNSGSRNNCSGEHKHIETTTRLSTFVENVINVEGYNKVVIAEVSSDEDSPRGSVKSPSRRSSRSSHH